jgi:hypothetical protein
MSDPKPPCWCCACQHSRTHTHDGCTACHPPSQAANPKDPQAIWNRVQQWIDSHALAFRRQPEFGPPQPADHAPHRGFHCPPQNMPQCPGFTPRTSEPEDDVSDCVSLDEPCLHPARKGIHEVYVGPGGVGQYCRACGAAEGLPQSVLDSPPYMAPTVTDIVARITELEAAIREHRDKTRKPTKRDQDLWKALKENP